jgi:uncharacterized membrane protein YciS (DUF1049 family)
MTSTQTIKLTVIIMAIICLVAWYIYNGASASDMDCFNYSISQADYKWASTLKEKVAAKKKINYRNKFCFINK